MYDKTSISAYYRKSAFVLRFIRYIVTILLLIFILFSVFLFRNDITVENIRLLAKFITIADGSSDLYTHEFSVNTNLDTDAVMMRDNLAVINSNNISLYYLSGQKLFSYDYTYSTPAVSYDKHNIMVYDIGGNELSVFNSFSKLYSKKFEGGIRSAVIGTDCFAVVTSEDSYKSVMAVYKYSLSENEYREVFKYLSSHSYITSIDLTDDASHLLSTFVTADNGAYKSSVSIFETSSDTAEAKYSVQINDEIPIKSGFTDNEDSIFVITDSAIHFYDAKLTHHSEYRFNQSKISNFFENETTLVLTEKNNLSGNSMTLTGISKSAGELFSIIVDDEIHDIAFGKNKIFALGDDKVFEITLDGNGNYSLTASAALNTKYNCVVSDTKDNCYIIDNISTRKINFK